MLSYARHNAGTVGDNSNLWDLPNRRKPYVYGLDSQMITLCRKVNRYIAQELQLCAGTNSQQPLERPQLTNEEGWTYLFITSK